jgi:hypothetical protein
VQVGIGVFGHVVVDNHVDTLDINSSAKQVCGNHDTGLEFLELSVLLNSFFLLDTGVNAQTGEVALNQELVELGGTGDRANEDDELVELEGVQEVDELSVLLVLCEANVVLLEPVQCELGTFIDVDLEGL